MSYQPFFLHKKISAAIKTALETKDTMQCKNNLKSIVRIIFHKKRLFSPPRTFSKQNRKLTQQQEILPAAVLVIDTNKRYNYTTFNIVCLRYIELLFTNKRSMDILETIRKMRLERGWTEYQLAEHSGLTQSTISSWYRKNMQPSVASLERICSAFNITLSQFFAASPAEHEHTLILTQRQNEFLKEFSRLNHRQQTAVLELIKSI